LRNAGVNNTGTLSTQVLQEFYITAVKKIGIEPFFAKELLHHFHRFETVIVTPHPIADAIDCSILNRISFWNALLIVAAESAGCWILFSEDLNDGQVIRGVQIKNPFNPM